MDVWLAFAFISRGIVLNIACYLYTGYTEANEGAKAFSGDPDAFAVDVTHCPVQIDDIYENGAFYRDTDQGRIQIDYLPTVQQQTIANTSNIASNSDSIDDLWVAILEG